MCIYPYFYTYLFVEHSITQRFSIPVITSHMFICGLCGLKKKVKVRRGKHFMHGFSTVIQLSPSHCRLSLVHHSQSHTHIHFVYLS